LRWSHDTDEKPGSMTAIPAPGQLCRSTLRKDLRFGEWVLVVGAGLADQVVMAAGRIAVVVRTAPVVSHP
jgi:hypothetical protein